jgi:FkbM family methyltransferase
MLMLKSILKTFIRSFGIDVVKFPTADPLTVQLKEIFRRENINLVIDVGAHDGGFVRFLRGSIGYDGKIVSFEPTASTFSNLKSKMALDRNWKGFNLGVSDRDGPTVLYTHSERSDFNSILSLKETGARLFDVDLAKSSMENILLTSLITIWDQITTEIDEPRVFLKCDTQGQDAAVIRGAQSALSKIHCIQCELPVIEIYDDMLLMSDALKELKTLGYIPAGFHPVNQAYNGVAAEFDVLFVRAR